MNNLCPKCGNTAGPASPSKSLGQFSPPNGGMYNLLPITAMPVKTQVKVTLQVVSILCCQSGRFTFAACDGSQGHKKVQ